MKKKYRGYTRRCKRCNKLYNTNGKYSKICKKCNKQNEHQKKNY